MSVIAYQLRVQEDTVCIKCQQMTEKVPYH
jgi:hypothetical protein